MSDYREYSKVVRVGLRFYPFCDGTITEILEPLKVGQIVVSEKYRVKWDNPEYGESTPAVFSG